MKCTYSDTHTYIDRVWCRKFITQYESKELVSRLQQVNPAFRFHLWDHLMPVSWNDQHESKASSFGLPRIRDDEDDDKVKGYIRAKIRISKQRLQTLGKWLVSPKLLLSWGPSLDRLEFGNAIHVASVCHHQKRPKCFCKAHGQKAGTYSYSLVPGTASNHETLLILPANDLWDQHIYIYILKNRLETFLGASVDFSPCAILPN